MYRDVDMTKHSHRRARRRPGRSTLAAGLVALLAVLAPVAIPPPPAAASAIPDPGGMLVPVTPCRVADTRVVGPPLGGSVRTFAVTGTGLASQGGSAGGCGVPTGAIAAVLTFTAVTPTGSGFLRAWPADQSPPTATILNYSGGASQTNSAEIPLAGTGDIRVRNFNSGTHLVIDVTGYFTTTAAERFNPVTPCRIADTRVVGPPLGGTTRTFVVAGSGLDAQGGATGGCGVPTSATAAVVSISAVTPAGAGYLRAWPADEVPPTATLVNYSGSSTTNTTTVKLSASDQISLRNFGAGTHVVIDVTGYYSSTGSVFVPVTPCRLVDTRLAGGQMAGSEREHSAIGLQPRSQGGNRAGCGLPYGTTAAVASLSAVNPAGAGYLRSWPADQTMPNATVLNYAAGTSTTNTAPVPLDGIGTVRNRNFGSATHLVVDVTGFFVAPGTSTHRVSLASGGGQALGTSYGSSVSADGRFVAFASQANNLVAGDGNGTWDVFVHDRWDGSTKRASLTHTSSEADGPSVEPSISPDGRYVAFVSAATNLVPSDTNARDDVFVRDLVEGTTLRVSVSTGGAQANDHSTRPSISVDGRRVAFETVANNLVAGDINGFADVFVRDVKAGTTTLVSVNAAGTGPGSSGAYQPVISGDGTRVAFASDSVDLIVGDTNLVTDVFLRDLGTGTTSRVSVSQTGDQSNGPSTTPSIDFDGDAVAFTSYATNLIFFDTNGAADVFVRFPTALATLRVSVDGSGGQANADSGGARLSGDGRAVAFASDATNLVVGDTNSSIDTFVHHLRTSSTVRASLGDTGAQLPSAATPAGIDMIGTWVLFETLDPAVASDTNGTVDVFLRGFL
jgi:Tol biopolymer transport system component